MRTSTVNCQVNRAGLLGFSFSPITNQSNDGLFLAGIAGEKWMLGFRTSILVQDLYKFLLADHPDRMICTVVNR
jgi:hypothetical protein